jgi:hypothetical protein
MGKRTVLLENIRREGHTLGVGERFLVCIPCGDDAPQVNDTSFRAFLRQFKGLRISGSRTPPADSPTADFAEAYMAAGSEPIDMAAGPLPLPRSRSHAVPSQSLPALCEIRSCFAPDSAPIPEAFWHRTRPTLSPELVPILTAPVNSSI